MRFHLTQLGAIFLAIGVLVIIASVSLYFSNVNRVYVGSLFDSMNESLTHTRQTVENQENFKLIEASHQRTTQALERATVKIEQVLTTMNETQRNIAELTNDIFIMQKSELESRKTLGQFLAIVAANNNITIPEELRKRLFIEESQPQQSAPPSF